MYVIAKLVKVSPIGAAVFYQLVSTPFPSLGKAPFPSLGKDVDTGAPKPENLGKIAGFSVFFGGFSPLMGDQ